jgi:SAM-dependent methyltransferase
VPDAIDPISIYETLYAKTDYEMHRKGCPRFDAIRNWCVANVPPGSTILEVGVGRGGLMTRLAEAGFVVYGTECVQYLRENDLAHWGTRIMPYRCQDLHLVQSNFFDCVICSDVLEHLTDAVDVAAALDDLARIARDHLVVTVGLTKANADKWIGVDFNLHALSDDPVWWRKLVGMVATIRSEHYDKLSAYFYCTARKD